MSASLRTDLHMHTTARDGQYSPAELVTMARDRHLMVIAITDHDTTDGVAEAQTAAHIAGTTLQNPVIVPGIELSAEDTGGDVHMLGYWMNIEDVQLQGTLTRFRQDRAERAKRIVEKLDKLGMSIRYERVIEIAEASGRRGGAIGRPHVARAMIEAGYADSIADAFARWLSPGLPAYVARDRLSPEAAIALIHSAGGAAVMAHPAKVPEYRAMVIRLVAAGLDGVEVVHPANDANTRLELRGLAAIYGLITTGGSDFHGRGENGEIALGQYNPPPDTWRLLQFAAEKHRSTP